MQLLPFQSLDDLQDMFFHNLNNNPFSEWLYGGWNERKWQQYAILHAIPGVSDYMDYLLDYRSDKEYFNRYGMDYSNIHDPRKLSATSSLSGTVRTGFNFVSKNVTKLYR